MTVVLRLVFAAGAALLAMSTACGGSSEPAAGPFAAAIRRTPAAALESAEFGRAVTMVDLRRVRAVVPPGRGTGDPFVDLLVGMQDTGIGSPGTIWSFSRSHAVQVAALLRATGIDPDQFDLLLETGVPPALLSIAFGDFDVSRTTARLRGCSDCPKPEMVTYRGAEVFTWGDPLQLGLDRRLAPPLFDELGRGGAVAITDTAAVRGFSVPALRRTLDSLSGDGIVLDEGDDLVLLAAALDQAHTLNAYISDGVKHQAGAAVPGEVTLRPYTAFALGQRLDGEEVVLVIALFHESPAGAKENASRFKQRVATARSSADPQRRSWSDLFPVVETVADGPIMIATLRGPGARSWNRFVVLADPLLLAEK